MNKKNGKSFSVDPWMNLKQFTDARIALGRCGSSLPLHESLQFKLAHARARDAVLQPFDSQPVKTASTKLNHPVLILNSQVENREEFLVRPDLGKKLSEDSISRLKMEKQGYDICIAISNGLSSPAIHDNVPPFLEQFLPTLQNSRLSVSPLCIVENGRVAVADEISSHLHARMSVILIGERPGLSSPNSLGIYLTYEPAPGTTDEARNCISNVRSGGLPIPEGVRKLCYLIEEAFRLQLSGVKLKDRMNANYLPFGNPLPKGLTRN